MENIVQGDCLEKINELRDNSIDAVVTDPPYGISFMGKKWDYDVPQVEVWKEVYRVLKPGAHMLVACGTRTQHRMTVNIEDAGFEIRDIVAWIYGSGFPKSLNVGKAVDKLQGNKRAVVGVSSGAGKLMEERPWNQNPEYDKNVEVTKGNSPWEGWGTALKPAMELWTLARKPLGESTVAENVLKWGVGGLNIDGCRVEAQGKDLEQLNSEWDREWNTDYSSYAEKVGGSAGFDMSTSKKENANLTGRWPANLIHDGSDEVVSGFPNDSQRFFYCAKAGKTERNKGLEGFEAVRVSDGRKTEHHVPNLRTTPKANFHPTVKPVSLMRYLCKLITPPNGTILDPLYGLWQYRHRS